MRKMDVMQAIKERRSIRRYQQRPVADEILTTLMEAVRVAPSASNRQEWRFIVVKDRAQIEKLATITGQLFLATAPVIVAGVALNPERVMRCEVPAYAVDLSIALTHLMLAAVEHGLGTCWIGWFDQNEVKRTLRIPDEYKVVGLLTLGYPAESPDFRGRKPLNEVVSYDYF